METKVPGGVVITDCSFCFQRLFHITASFSVSFILSSPLKISEVLPLISMGGTHQTHFCSEASRVPC